MGRLLVLGAVATATVVMVTVAIGSAPAQAASAGRTAPAGRSALPGAAALSSPVAGVAKPSSPVAGVATQSSPVVGVAATRKPFGDYVGRLVFDVTSIDPALVTATGPAVVTITGTMSNTGPETLTELSYRFQRGAALRSTADVRQELGAPTEPLDQVQNTFVPIVSTLAAGASAPFAFTAPIVDPRGLDITAPGVYPLMVNVNGAVMLQAGPLAARVGELHLLLTVMSVPGQPAAGVSAPPAGTGAQAMPLNFVWPLVDVPHLGVGGVFLNDDLTSAIAPAGRLTTLVDGLTDDSASRLPAGSVTVVMDPQLLDELDRMSGGYRVVAGTGESQPPMTAMLQAQASLAATTTAQAPEATQAGTTDAGQPPVEATVGAPTTGEAPAGSVQPTAESSAAGAGLAEIPGTVVGTGQAAAASFLARLRDVAARYPVLVLPYGDPDAVALVRSGQASTLLTAVSRGREVAQRVLGSNAVGLRDLNLTTAYPIDGAADAATLDALRSDGIATALLSGGSIDADGRASSSALMVVPTEGPGTSGPVTSIPAAIAQTDVLDGVDALIDRSGQSGWARQVNSLTAVLAQQRLDGGVGPAIFMPARRWSPDAPALQVLTDLLGTLSSSGVIGGMPLSQMVAAPTINASPDYPKQARSQELSADYLQRIARDRDAVASLRRTLTALPQASDPAAMLDPLDEALDAAASTAFRQDPTVGDANLSTVESTTASIRQGVAISSAGNSYTLASSTSPLVLTVQNTLPYQVQVKVVIPDGDRVGLAVGDNTLQTVAAGRSQQVKIPTEVSRSGQFQVTAQLVGADGTAWGNPVQLSVESNAYGGLTVVIIVVAGGVLVVMVVLRIVQRVRKRPDRSITPGETPGDKDPAADNLAENPANDRRRESHDGRVGGPATGAGMNIDDVPGPPVSSGHGPAGGST